MQQDRDHECSTRTAPKGCRIEYGFSFTQKCPKIVSHKNYKDETDSMISRSTGGTTESVRRTNKAIVDSPCYLTGSLERGHYRTDWVVIKADLCFIWLCFV